MVKNKKGIIGSSIVGFIIFSLIILSIALGPKEDTEVPCYDRSGNKIIEQTCIQRGVDLETYELVLMWLVGSIGFIIINIPFKRR